jgi:hypothetical protein
MAISSNGQVSASDINTELGRSASSQKSLDDARRGNYAQINQVNEDKPPISGQVSYSDWRGYDHDKVSLSAIPISSVTSSKAACGAKILRNGYFDNALNIGSAGFFDINSTNPLGDGYYNTNQGKAIEIINGKISKIAICK